MSPVSKYRRDMRITIVQGPFLPVPPLRGGAIEKAWFSLGQEFARAGHQVTHVSRRFPGMPDAEIIGQVRHLRMGGSDAPRPSRGGLGFDWRWPLRPALDLCYALRVRPVLPDADILVTNSFVLPMLMPGDGPAGKLYVHVGRYPRAQIARYLHAARLQAPSGAIARALQDRWPKAAARVRAIPYPLAPEMRLRSVEEFERMWPAREKAIVFAGRIHPQKGLELLLGAFAKFAASEAGCDWRLRLIGPHEESHGGGGSSYLAGLKRLTPSLAGRIEWLGFVSEPAILRGHLETAGAFVYPSLDEHGETFGVAPLEAMGCGVPVLVSDLACFRDFLKPGETGFVFNQRAVDPAADLAARLNEIAADHEMRRSIARRGWEATARFEPGIIGSRFLADFAELNAAN